jgi:sulfite exporter TauE/SafE
MRRFTYAVLGASVGFIAGSFAAVILALSIPVMAAVLVAAVVALPFAGAVRGMQRLQPRPTKSLPDQLGEALDDILADDTPPSTWLPGESERTR